MILQFFVDIQWFICIFEYYWLKFVARTINLFMTNLAQVELNWSACNDFKQNNHN